jgi:hypothetical protein
MLDVVVSKAALQSPAPGKHFDAASAATLLDTNPKILKRTKDNMMFEALFLSDFFVIQSSVNLNRKCIKIIHFEAVQYSDLEGYIE